MTDERSNSSKPNADIVAEDANETNRGRYGWLSLAVAGVFALFFAYDVWEAVGNLISLPQFYEASGLDPAGLPWWLLWIGVIVPVVVFVVAFIIGRHRNVGEKAVIFFVGLAVSSGLGFGVIALESLIRPTVSLLGA
ncbi:MAG: hypothetical protein LH471_09990 [Salinibacterium sp.]|nr:hypothetical protein [Salinibacterium sp.]